MLDELDDFGENIDYDALAPVDGANLPRGYLSTSQAVLYTKCGHQYYLKYIAHLQGLTPYRMFEGVAVHHGTEHALRRRMELGAPPPTDEVLDVVADYYRVKAEVVGDWEGVTPGEGKDRGVTLMRAFCAEALPTALPIMVEEQFTRTVTGPVEGRAIPFVGRLDSVQLRASSEEHLRMNGAEASCSTLPRILVDLKVTSDSWNDKHLRDSLQLALYADIMDVPDVRVDQLVKGRGKKFRPHYKSLEGTVTKAASTHALEVVEGVAKGIMAGVFTKTDPSNWWCSAQWCGQWHHCRGKTK